MQLFQSIDLSPHTYIAFDRGVRDNEYHPKLILFIGHAIHDVNIDMSKSCFYRDGSAVVVSVIGSEFYYRPNKVCTYKGEPMSAPMVYEQADDSDPMWDVLRRKYPDIERPTPAPVSWSEVDDAILRGWRNDLVLLCKVFPKRTLREIEDRKRSLH